MKIESFKLTNFLSVLILLCSFGCSTEKSEIKVSKPTTEMKTYKFRVGGLYSVANGEGRFTIAKVLALDKEAVHVCLYKNKFSSRPQTLDLNVLSIEKTDEDNFGIGHLPLSQEGFANWQPIFITEMPVTEDELEGYEMWKEFGGGVWQ